MVEHTTRHVYFISMTDPKTGKLSRDMPIKIGSTGNLLNRLKTLQTGNPFPLMLVGVIPNGGMDVEVQLHERHKKQRLYGEWFSPYWKLHSDIRNFANEKKLQCVECGRWFGDWYGMFLSIRRLSRIENPAFVPPQQTIQYLACLAERRQPHGSQCKYGPYYVSTSNTPQKGVQYIQKGLYSK